MAVAAHKHTDLEEAMADLARAQMRTEDGLLRLERNIDRLESTQERTEANLDKMSAERHALQVDTKANLDRLSAEMRAGQEDTKANLERLSAEMRAGQEDTKANLDRQSANLDQLEAQLAQSFAKNDMAMAELRENIDRSNRKAGEAINRAGRLVEDIVAPGIHDFFRATFGWEGDISSSIRIHRTPRGKPDGEREFDAFAAGGDTFLLVSVKSTVSADRINELLGQMATVRDFFPEAENRRAYGVMASLYMDLSVVKDGERKGLLMIGLQPGLLTVLNSPGFKPKEF